VRDGLLGAGRRDRLYPKRGGGWKGGGSLTISGAKGSEGRAKIATAAR